MAILRHCLVEGCIWFAVANFAGFNDKVKVKAFRLHKCGFASLFVPKAIVRQDGQRVILSRSAECLDCLRHEWILNHSIFRKITWFYLPLSSYSASGQTSQSPPCDSVSGNGCIKKENYGNQN